MAKIDQLMKMISESGNEELQKVFIEYMEEGIDKRQAILEKFDKLLVNTDQNKTQTNG